jgi:hypothetical protein
VGRTRADSYPEPELSEATKSSSCSIGRALIDVSDRRGGLLLGKFLALRANAFLSSTSPNGGASHWARCAHGAFCDPRLSATVLVYHNRDALKTEPRPVTLSVCGPDTRPGSRG